MKYTTDREAVYSQLLEETTFEKNIFGAYTEETSRKTYTYGLGLISERRDNGEEYHYHYNHLGSTTAVSDKEGNLVYRFVYDTYGELADIRDADKNSLGKIAASEHYTLSELAHAIGITFLYNGQYGVSTDRNGLYYMRARYYNQDIKRFINRDIVKGSITDSTSLNRYSYVQGNPVSLTDPFGLCPDPNSRFKSLCMAIYHTDWNNVGHTVLSVAGIFWEGADAINAVWYALEGNTEMALSCALSAIPGAGMAVGNLLMKSQKLSSAGRAIHAVSKLTQGGMGIGAGIGMAASGFGDFATGLKNGQFDGKALARGFLGVGIAALSGRNVAGTAKSINKAISNAGTPTKNPGGWGDISGAPVGMGNPNIRSVAGEMLTYRVPGVGGTTGIVPYYPPYNGAVAGTEKKIYLMAGDKIDRYGGIKGKYFSPINTPMNMRALPYDADLSQYKQFEVVKPFEVEASTIAPAFGKIGLGTQYRASVSAEILLKKGIIKQVGEN